MDKNEILSVYERQKAIAFQSPLRNAKYRIKMLNKLYKNIILLKDEIIRALNVDLGKSEVESYMAEIGLVLSEISYMKKHLKGFSKPKRVATPLAQFASKSYVQPMPKGQVLIISPWNYPFMLSIEPLVDAIAAGNVAMIKPSESSSHVSVVIDKLINMTFSKEEVFVVLGGREECSFLLDLDFDHIFFTGSSRVGKIVMQKAAEHFTTVTLELGGKSPCVVDETANLKLAAKRIVFGKFLNSGQTCVAPDYIYCHKSIKEKLVNELKRQIILQYSVDALSNKEYPKIINQKQFDGLVRLIEEGNVIFGGKFDEGKLKIEPTILDSGLDTKEMQQEIFGPILPILSFENISEVVENINKRNSPLALYIFSSSKKNIDRVINGCGFGGGCINDTIIHLATSNMGFGGLKYSGIGAYHGKAGFDAFSHYKSIVDKKTWLDLPMRYQPYSKLKYNLIKLFLK